MLLKYPGHRCRQFYHHHWRRDHACIDGDCGNGRREQVRCHLCHRLLGNYSGPFSRLPNCHACLLIPLYPKSRWLIPEREMLFITNTVLAIQITVPLFSERTFSGVLLHFLLESIFRVKKVLSTISTKTENKLGWHFIMHTLTMKWWPKMELREK